MHTSDLSDWDNRDHPRDRHGWSKMTRNVGIKPFMQDTGPNVANFAENGTFFPKFFKPTMIETIVEQTNKYAREMITAKPNGD